jgi:hypothetical protein
MCQQALIWISWTLGTPEEDNLDTTALAPRAPILAYIR